MPKNVLSGPGAGPDTLPFSKIVEANGLVFLAGQVGSKQGTTGAVEGGIEAETRQMLDNVSELLTSVGLGFADVVKATVYLVDFDEFAQMNAIYRQYFPTDPPTRATVGVTRLAANYRVEIEVIAAR
jgi:2-iminobutanoate/2-iminopropanoate deaminase